MADLIRQGRKIEAIKALRERHDLSLADAKAAVEQLMVEHERQASARVPPAVPEGVAPAGRAALALAVAIALLMLGAVLLFVAQAS